MSKEVKFYFRLALAGVFVAFIGHAIGADIVYRAGLSVAIGGLAGEILFSMKEI